MSRRICLCFLFNALSFDTNYSCRPIPNAERSAVKWLMDVIEEEGKRAKRIAESDGELVRPKDNEEGGPLSDLERRAIQFLSGISDSEVERVRSGTIRIFNLSLLLSILLTNITQTFPFLQA